MTKKSLGFKRNYNLLVDFKEDVDNFNKVFN